MAEYVVNSFIDGEWEYTDPMTETEARAEGVNQNGSILADLERDGYTIRYLQCVLAGPSGEVAIVEVEPV